MKIRASLVLALATLPLLSMPAHSATSTSTAKTPYAAPTGTAPDGLPRWNTAPQSRQEHLERMKLRVSTLEKMTDAQWAERRKQQQDRRAQRQANQPSRVNPTAAPAASGTAVKTAPAAR